MADAAEVRLLEEHERERMRSVRGGDVWLCRNRDRLDVEGLISDGRVFVTEGLHGLEAVCVASDGPAGVIQIEHLYTRESGAGDDLLRYVRHRVRERWGSQLWVVTLPGDRAGKSRCEEMGITGALIIMREAHA